MAGRTQLGLRAREILSLGLLVLGILWPSGAVPDASASPALPGAGANRTVPSASPPPRVPSFSANPADAEFLRASLSQEPLVPAWRTTAEENRDLADALRRYDVRVRAGATDDVRPLTAFLAGHPGSAWGPSLLVSLGTI
jgi:hypothetical protein